MRTIKFLLLKFVIIVFCFLFINIATSNENLVNPELKRNRELWRNNNICSYKMTLEITESSVMYLGLPHVAIQIRNGIFAEIETIPKTDKGGIIQERYEKYFTIEKLFDFVEFKIEEEKQQYINSDVNRRGKITGGLTVSYNFKLGYPEKIDFAPYHTAIHGDLRIIVKSFENMSVEYNCK